LDEHSLAYEVMLPGNKLVLAGHVTFNEDLSTRQALTAQQEQGYTQLLTDMFEQDAPAGSSDSDSDSDSDAVSLIDYAAASDDDDTPHGEVQAPHQDHVDEDQDRASPMVVTRAPRRAATIPKVTTTPTESLSSKRVRSHNHDKISEDEASQPQPSSTTRPKRAASSKAAASITSQLRPGTVVIAPDPAPVLNADSTVADRVIRRKRQQSALFGNTNIKLEDGIKALVSGHYYLNA
jgi:hypothetical protein